MKLCWPFEIKIDKKKNVWLKTFGIKMNEMSVSLKIFRMEIDEMSFWLQYILIRNKWNWWNENRWNG